MREHLQTFLEDARETDGEGYPRFVEQAFRRYLECGVLAHGFARIRCPECGHEQLLAFSCKSRLCPSCQARRMSETAAYLRDHLLPHAPYRQWVLTVPWVLRPRLLVDRGLLSAVLGLFLRTVFAWQRKRGRSLGIARGYTGAVTYIQRFGGALNAHPHFHSVIPDGLFVDGVESSSPRAETATAEARRESKRDATDTPMEFVTLPPPEPDDIEELTVKIARRITRLVVKRTEEETAGGRMTEVAASLETALARALRAPPPADQLSFAEPDHDHEADARSLCARVAGFSLHAGRAIRSEQREALEQLCRYGLRAPFSQERLSVDANGQVLYELARPWPHAGGTRLLVLDPLEFLQRLAALLPGPYLNLVRYHGCFASRSKVRSRLPPPAERAEAEELERRAREATRGSSEAPSAQTNTGTEAGSAAAQTLDPDRPRLRPSRYRWAALLRRVLFLDPLDCPRCGSLMRVISVLTDPPVVQRILAHLDLPAQPLPLSPARVRQTWSLPLPDEPRPGEWADRDGLQVRFDDAATAEQRERSPP